MREILLLLLLLLAVSCSMRSDRDVVLLDEAEALMQQHPDSALLRLLSINGDIYETVPKIQ